MKDYNSLFNEKLGELIKDIDYPKESASPIFNCWVQSALKHHTETTLQCTLAEYEKVYEALGLLSTEQCKMPTMYLALNATMSVTPAQLYSDGKFDASLYISAKKELIEMKRTWDTIAAPYIKQAQEAVKAISESDLQKENAMRGLKPKKRLLLPS